MEYTIEITTYCQHNCNYCSTNADKNGNHLSIKDIKYFLSENNVLYTDRINISGGEPLAHPDFWDILQLCKAYSDNVWVYTNAIPNIRYNSNILEEMNIEANVCLTPGEKVYIPKNADKVHLLQLVPQGRAKNMKPANTCIRQLH